MYFPNISLPVSRYRRVRACACVCAWACGRLNEEWSVSASDQPLSWPSLSLVWLLAFSSPFFLFLIPLTLFFFSWFPIHFRLGYTYFICIIFPFPVFIFLFFSKFRILTFSDSAIVSVSFFFPQIDSIYLSLSPFLPPSPSLPFLPLLFLNSCPYVFRILALSPFPPQSTPPYFYSTSS